MAVQWHLGPDLAKGLSQRTVACEMAAIGKKYEQTTRSFWMGTVNFPEHLDITPSVTPKFEGAPSDTRTMGAIFGAAAQREAIEKYGIAGRVW